MATEKREFDQPGSRLQNLKKKNPKKQEHENKKDKN